MQKNILFFSVWFLFLIYVSLMIYAIYLLNKHPNTRDKKILGSFISLILAFFIFILIVNYYPSFNIITAISIIIIMLVSITVLGGFMLASNSKKIKVFGIWIFTVFLISSLVLIIPLLKEKILKKPQAANCKTKMQESYTIGRPDRNISLSSHWLKLPNYQGVNMRIETYDNVWYNATVSIDPDNQELSFLVKDNDKIDPIDPINVKNLQISCTDQNGYYESLLDTTITLP